MMPFHLRRFHRVLPFVLLAAVAATACDSATGASGPPIFISATWQDKNDPLHSINFQSTDDGKREGTLTGKQFHPSCLVDGCPVTGAWAAGRIEILITRGGTGLRYQSYVQTENPPELLFQRVGGSDSFTLLRP